jgi:hypothetical protein
MTAPAIRITARVARRLLREVVAEAGRGYCMSYSCTYYDAVRLCPRCIVGQALFRAGLTDDELSRMDNRRPTVISSVQVPARLRMSAPARRVFEAAQVAQDKGCEWGAALDVALAVRPWAAVA